jgi:hypothetical protein
MQFAEPTVDELIARKDETGVNTTEPQFVYWLRVGVFNYLRSNTEHALRSNWPAIRQSILDAHGYGS